MSIQLGVSDRVIVQDPKKNKTWSGKVMQIDRVLIDCTMPYVGFEYNAFVELDGGVSDYREILLQGWPIYYRDNIGHVKKYYISEYSGPHEDFKIVVDGSYNLLGMDSMKGSWENIVSILISTKYFTVVPTHQTNLATSRFPV
jgi:hypothetical protein